MLKRSVVEHTLEAALETGADFAEVYVERPKRKQIGMATGIVCHADLIPFRPFYI